MGTPADRLDAAQDIMAMFDPSNALHAEYCESIRQHDHDGLALIQSQIYREVGSIIAEAAVRYDELYQLLRDTVPEAYWRMDEIRRNVMRSVHLHDHFRAGGLPPSSIDAATCADSLRAYVQSIGERDDFTDRTYASFAAGVLLKILEVVVELEPGVSLNPKRRELYNNLISNPPPGRLELSVVAEIDSYPEDSLRDHSEQIQRIIDSLEQMDPAFRPRSNMVGKLRGRLNPIVGQGLVE